MKYRKRLLPVKDENLNGKPDLSQSPSEVFTPNGPLLLFTKVNSKSNFVFYHFDIFITFRSKLSFKSYFSQIFLYIMSKMVFTLAWYVQQQVLRDLHGETSCILYFFGLGKYMKKSLWSHLSALF